MAYSTFDVIKANSFIGPTNEVSTGQVYYVSNSTTLPPNGIGGSDGNSGKSPLEPFSTIDYAVGRCTASRGDKIYVMPGHSETITAAGGLDLDVAGISVIGLGNGRNRPVLAFSTAVGADIDFDAANITLKNFRITTVGIDALTGPLDINAADCEVSDCEFVMADGTNQATKLVVTATAADRFKFLRNIVRAPNAGADSAIQLVGTEDGIEIARNHIYGDFAVAAIENALTNVLTNANIHDNFIRNTNAADFSIELLSAVTGVISDNYLVSDAVATALDPGSCHNFNNKWSDQDLADSSGGTMPDIIVDAASNIAGADTADNSFASTNVVPNEDGSLIERLEQLQEAVNKGTGTALAANKSLVDALGTDGTTVTDAAVSVLGSVGADNANNAFASTLVAANEDGSVLERLEQVQEAVNKGTGTALAANKSLVDALGTDGTAVTDAAVSVLGAIGADSANNVFASTLVAANEDGSVLERLEQMQEAVNKGTGTALAANKSLVDALGTDGTTVTDAAASVLGAVGADNANNVFASTLVAANEDGSVLERLEQVQEAVNKGTGTALAANKSLVDALGTDGTTVTDAAVSVLGAIGADNANNAFASTLVAPNEDGSVLERLEQIQEAVNRGTGTALAANESLADVLYATNGIVTFPAAAAPANGISMAEVEREIFDQIDKSISTAAATMVNGTTIFTITGGPIEILSLCAVCVTANDITASTLQYSADGTDGAATTITGASTTLASVAAGTIVAEVAGTLATVPSIYLNGPGVGATVPIIVPAGIITIVIGVGSTTGTWTHNMRYRPLRRGVTVA